MDAAAAADTLQMQRLQMSSFLAPLPPLSISLGLAAAGSSKTDLSTSFPLHARASLRHCISGADKITSAKGALADAGEGKRGEVEGEAGMRRMDVHL